MVTVVRWNMPRVGSNPYPDAPGQESVDEPDRPGLVAFPDPFRWRRPQHVADNGAGVGLVGHGALLAVRQPVLVAVVEGQVEGAFG